MSRPSLSCTDCSGPCDLESCPTDSEHTMKKIRCLYHTKDIGLLDAAEGFQDGCQPDLSDNSFVSPAPLGIAMPRQKLSVLILGSHTAAKQRFLDLYFNDPRGAPLGTADWDNLDKIFVTHGHRQKTLVTGEDVLDYYPHLADLAEIPDLRDSLTTEISARDTKSLISFILAPSPEDPSKAANNNGTSTSKKRPVDMSTALEKLAETADLILLFISPTGIPSPAQTLAPFHSILALHSEKLSVILAHASEDEATFDTRQQVVTLLVQELLATPTFQEDGFLPEIYFPDLSRDLKDDQRLWTVISQKVDSLVSSGLQKLQEDATLIQSKLDAILLQNDLTSREKWVSDFFTLTAFITLLFYLLECGIFWNSPAFWEKVMTTSQKVILSLLVAILLFKTYFPPTASLPPDQEKLLRRRLQLASHALFWTDSSQKSGGVLVGLGYPLLEATARVEDPFLEKYGLLGDSENVTLPRNLHFELINDLVDYYSVQLTAGGAAQNALRVAQWILPTPNAVVFLGSLGSDQWSTILKEKVASDCVLARFQTVPQLPTGTCAVRISDHEPVTLSPSRLTIHDQHRYLCTHLGAAAHFSKTHLKKPPNWTLIEAARFFFLDGAFLESCPEPVLSIAQHSSDTDKCFLLRLSDSPSPLITTGLLGHCQVLFASHRQVVHFLSWVNDESLTTVSSDMAALAKAFLECVALFPQNASRPRTLVITQGPGPVLVAHLIEGVFSFEQFPVPHIRTYSENLDITGAGDAFIGGFLAQYIQQKSLSECVSCGIWAAQEVLQCPGSTFPKDKKYPQ